MKKFYVESDELVLKVSVPSGATLELDKELIKVSMYPDEIDYSDLMKLVKVLRRQKNKEQFSVENCIEWEE